MIRSAETTVAVFVAIMFVLLSAPMMIASGQAGSIARALKQSTRINMLPTSSSKDYQEVCRYLRTIGYGTKGKAEPVEREQQVARELEPGAYCDLRTTVLGKRSTQEIAVFVNRDLAGNLFGSGLVVASLYIGCELAKQFADTWFEKRETFMNEALFK